MILVTGAAGQTGLAVLDALRRRGAPARALVSRASSAGKVEAAGARDVAVGDLESANDVRRAAEGCSAIYHVCPVMSDAEPAIGGRVIAAARAAGARVVFHSLVHAQIDALPHHRDKRLVEQALIESGLAYTILKPTMYMQNTRWSWASIVERGVYRLPYSVDARMSLVDLDDVAEAAAIVLSEPGWDGGEFELCSGDNLTRVEMAAALSEALGRDVHAEAYGIDEWKRDAATTRTPFAIARVAAMYAHYDRHGLRGGNPRVLALILGRQPTSFRGFAAKAVAAWGGAATT